MAQNNDLLDNTTIMVTNDHGQVSKESLYEQGIRIMNFIQFSALNWHVVTRYMMTLWLVM